MRRVLALLIGVALLAACGPTPDAADERGLEMADIQGYWILETFATGGAAQAVDPGVNTRTVPWLEITDSISGNSGCNGFGNQPGEATLVGDILSAGEIFSELGRCLSEEPDVDVMQAEEAFQGIFRGDDPITVEVDGDEMTWSANGVTLVFTRSDGPPPTTTLPPRIEHANGRLVCGAGIVVETRVADNGQEPLDVAKEAAPGVVELIPGDPLWWWGVNEEGVVIVALALGDMVGADYQVSTCDPPLEGTTTEGSLALPDFCYEYYALGTPELPPDSFIVAELPFHEGVIVVYRQDTSGTTYYQVMECYPGGGEGYSGGGPGETWQGCYRVDYSASGFAIATVEDPDWMITIAGEPVDVVETADGVGVALLEGSFDQPPSVGFVDDVGAPCEN